MKESPRFNLYSAHELIILKTIKSSGDFGPQRNSE